jgi:hypothetical protein
LGQIVANPSDHFELLLSSIVIRMYRRFESLDRTIPKLLEKMMRRIPGKKIFFIVEYVECRDSADFRVMKDNRV